MAQVVEKFARRTDVAERREATALPGWSVPSRLARIGGELSARVRQLPVPPDTVVGAQKIVQLATGGKGLWRSLLICVVLPSICYFFYGAFFESSEYVAEARLTVRAAQEQKQSISSEAMSVISKITGSGGQSSVQDSFIVQNYIKSRSIIADIGGRDYLENIYARQDVDYFSRLRKDADLEDLWKYWKTKIKVSIDTLSGIITLQVQAYTPEDALKTAQGIVDLSENLVNDISKRSRSDAVERAESEVKLFSEKLAQARRRLLEFRNQNVLIDPLARAKSVGEMIGQLTLERLQIDNNLKSLSGVLSIDSPSQRLQTIRLEAIDKQITALEQKLTDAKGNESVSAQLGTYEQLELNEKFAERMYSISQASYERARQEREKQLLYLVVVVRPTTPESATYPQVTLTTSLFFSSLLILWGIVALLVAAIKDQAI
ncbi:MAG: hypothetical protein NVS2B5_11360 [Beijerinckiaceae bacterium]